MWCVVWFLLLVICCGWCCMCVLWCWVLCCFLFCLLLDSCWFWFVWCCCLVVVCIWVIVWFWLCCFMVVICCWWVICVGELVKLVGIWWGCFVRWERGVVGRWNWVWWFCLMGVFGKDGWCEFWVEWFLILNWYYDLYVMVCYVGMWLI